MEISFQFTCSSSSSSSRFRHMLRLQRKLRHHKCLLCQMQHSKHRQQQQHHVRNPHLGSKSSTGRPHPTVIKTCLRTSLLFLLIITASYTVSQVTCTSAHTANALSSAPQRTHCASVTRRAVTSTRFSPTLFRSTSSPGACSNPPVCLCSNSANVDSLR